MNEFPITLAVMCPGENFSSRWVRNWTALLAHLTVTRQFGVIPCFDFCSSVYHLRNSMAEFALSIPGLDYVLWIDDDNILDVEQFERLWTDLEKQKDAAAVSAWAWCENQQYPTGAMISCGRILEDGRSVPFLPDEFIGTVEELKAGRGNRELRKVDYTGFPAILMHAHTLMEAGPNPFSPYVSEVFESGISGEDYAFCRHARERAGLKFYVDPLCQVPHLKLRAIQPTHLLHVSGMEKECAA